MIRGYWESKKVCKYHIWCNVRYWYTKGPVLSKSELSPFMGIVSQNSGLESYFHHSSEQLLWNSFFIYVHSPNNYVVVGSNRVSQVKSKSKKQP